MNDRPDFPDPGVERVLIGIIAAGALFVAMTFAAAWLAGKMADPECPEPPVSTSR